MSPTLISADVVFEEIRYGAALLMRTRLTTWELMDRSCSQRRVSSDASKTMRAMITMKTGTSTKAGWFVLIDGSSCKRPLSRKNETMKLLRAFHNSNGTKVHLLYRYDLTSLVVKTSGVSESGYAIGDGFA